MNESMPGITKIGSIVLVIKYLRYQTRYYLINPIHICKRSALLLENLFPRDWLQDNEKTGNKQQLKQGSYDRLDVFGIVDAYLESIESYSGFYIDVNCLMLTHISNSEIV